jgi:hypothetical protein
MPAFVGEGHVPHWWRAGLDHIGQNTPAVEHRDTGPHHCMGRQRVAAVGIAVNHQHFHARPGQQHCGRGAGASRADDDGVVAFAGNQ